ncbi:MAG: hypothetical protein NC041_02205 [Bacteroides sp.]|nr:hypothetical protein [Prevotella sp.]MCM1407584.1 hypothetical protein [Treponema brennaborense]MCM1469266.1 hypothetical protein [Bacteroides sp.]
MIAEKIKPEKKYSSHKEQAFNLLTPCYLSDKELGIYKDALDFAFDKNNKDIRNIALTGCFGSGKSSVIKSYEKISLAKSRKNFSYISLASFDENISNCNSESQKDLELKLEKIIVKQLINQIPAKQIPQTIFPVKKVFSKGRMNFSFFCCFVLFILISYCSLFYKINRNILCARLERLSAVFSGCNAFKFRFYTGIAAIILSYCIVHKIVQWFSISCPIKKVSFRGNEVEMNNETNDPIFDKYISEILYLFQMSKSTVFVFEDIDRFNNLSIFERLREINFLINSKTGSSVKFIYLIHDKLLSSAGKTKFFDYIIPIIPIADTSNAYNFFCKILGYPKENEQSAKDLITQENIPDKKTIRIISSYISEMRLIKNICNEFIIYRQKIMQIKPDINKLFAIIAYKNIFPFDFANLETEKGYLYSLLHSKNTAARIICRENYLKLKKYKNKLRLIKQELFGSIHELEQFVFNSYGYCIQKKDKTVIPFVTDSIFQKIKNNPEDYFVFEPVFSENKFRHINTYSYISKITGTQKKYFYDERKKYLQTDKNIRIKIIEKYIQNLQKQINCICNEKLQDMYAAELFNKNNDFLRAYILYDEQIIKKFPHMLSPLEDKNINQADFIFAMLRSGLIDESYRKYISLYYPDV